MPISLQQMREEFQQTPKKGASSIQPKERESSDDEEGGEDIVTGSEFPQLLQMHQQHWADYVHLSTEEGLPLTSGEDRAAPLVTEVHFMLFRFSIFCDHPLLISYSAFFPYSLFQALQKIWLANHIKKMAELLHANAVQQLEVALLGSPASSMVELISAGLEQIKPTQPCPQKFTTHLPAPLPVKVPVLGLDPSPVTEKIMKATESTDAPVPKHHNITLVPVTSSVPSLPYPSS